MLKMYRRLLPQWVSEIELSSPFVSDEDMVRFAVFLAGRNVAEGTGGPFGAALFDEEGELVAMGVNRVVPLRNAFLHAEFVCLCGALERFKAYSLPSSKAFTLAVSAQPCSMCLGSLIWAGVRGLLIGASKEHTERLAGFDEGPVHPNWKEELASRGISVRDGLLSEEACAVFKTYMEKGGRVYNRL